MATDLLVVWQIVVNINARAVLGTFLAAFFLSLVRGDCNAFVFARIVCCDRLDFVKELALLGVGLVFKLFRTSTINMLFKPSDLVFQDLDFLA